MDQRFEGTPQVEIRLDGKRLVRGEVVNDWGSQLVWEIRRNGQPVASSGARATDSIEFSQSEPGQYEAVLKMFQYEGYEKDKDGKFTKSKFIEVSNKVNWTI